MHGILYVAFVAAVELVFVFGKNGFKFVNGFKIIFVQTSINFVL
jgi:hypothetical protein